MWGKRCMENLCTFCSNFAVNLKMPLKSLIKYSISIENLRYSKSIGQNMVAIEMIVCHSSQEEGHAIPWEAMRDHTGKHQGQSGGKGSKGKGQQEPLLWFPWEAMGEAG